MADAPTTRTSAPRARSDLWIAVLRSRTELEATVVPWRALASHALEPNPFFEPYFLLPALRDESRELRVLAAWRPGGSASPETLCGLWPLVRQTRTRGIPVGALVSWHNPHTVLGTPLLHRRAPRETLLALLRAASAEPGASLVELRDLHTEGPVGHLLIDLAGELHIPIHRQEAATRGFLSLHGSAEAYFEAALDKDARRKLRSKTRALSALGPLRVDTLAPQGAVEPWIHEFLRLEASGWKGEAGTALASHPRDRALFEAVVRGAHAEGRLHFVALRLDEKAIAMKCNLLGAEGSFAWKIAFDETHASSSPGLLLEAENITQCHAMGRWQDSCAASSSRLFRELWLDRRTIETWILPTDSWLGPPLVASLPLLRWMKTRAAELLGHLRTALAAAPRETH